MTLGETKQSSPKGEGLNLFYKAASLAALLYMQTFPSGNYKVVQREATNSLVQFNQRFETIRDDPLFMSQEELKRRRLLKQKHLVYASYLAAMSSYPMLYRAAPPRDIALSSFAKASSVTATKVLDNINDQVHSFERAVNSLRRFDAALTESHFTFADANGDEVAKAENSSFMMARWAHDILADNVHPDSEMYRIYVSDIHKATEGQLASLRQKIGERRFEGYSGMSIGDYLRVISEKGVGGIWINIDLCFYEKNQGKLDGEERKAIESIRKGLDYIFKSTLIYDDVSDLTIDLRDSIVNSVIMLGIEQGSCSMEDVRSSSPGEVVKRLERSGVVRNTIHLADLVFLKGIEHLERARAASENMDIGASIFNARLLRAFNLRKWLMRTRHPRDMRVLMRSFGTLRGLRSAIPEYILSYERFLG
jgi:hypothetical protein